MIYLDFFKLWYNILSLYKIMNRPKEKILVVGGAVGTYLGARLHAAGTQVDLFGRRKIAHLGDRISIQEKEYAMPPRLTSLPEDASYDLVVLGTKLHHLPEILELMQRVRLHARLLVSIQNGLVDNTQFTTLLGEQKLLIASVFDGFRIAGNQLLTTNTGRGWKVEDSQEGAEVARILSVARIRCMTEANLDKARAEKSIVNCCLNGLSAIYNKTFMELFADSDLSARIERLFDECYAILATTFALDDRGLLKERLFQDWRYADHYSSTCQDFLEEKTTEIDFLNGYMVRLGRSHGLSTTENEKVLTELHDLESERDLK